MVQQFSELQFVCFVSPPDTTVLIPGTKSSQTRSIRSLTFCFGISPNFFPIFPGSPHISSFYSGQFNSHGLLQWSPESIRLTSLPSPLEVPPTYPENKVQPLPPHHPSLTSHHSLPLGADNTECPIVPHTQHYLLPAGLCSDYFCHVECPSPG